MVWVGLAFIVAGIAWSAYFIRLHRRAVAQAEAAQSWPTAEGVIAESGIAMDESYLVASLVGLVFIGLGLFALA